MNFTLAEFRNLTFAAFFLYLFFDTKIYLALWAALFHLIGVAIKTFFLNEAMIYKTVIAVYVFAVLAGYLYNFRNVLASDKKTSNNGKFEKLRSDKIRQRRAGIAILLLMMINVIAVFLWRT